ncbi:MAG: sugar phosphate isomerase/epimerase [Bacteroidetes bacterium]|nr:sugar phosphate isomerase/epimerase [Bacteroidota bacterium]MBS1974030.1 sugar phosphate isomerase/epimerase [Bacteroidota bacterium]
MVTPKQLPRREFLRSGATVALGSLLLPEFALSELSAAKPKMALQLYTVRKEIEKNLAGTLHRLSEIGIKTVETAFWPKNITLKEAAKHLKEAGLQVCSSHIEIPVGDKKNAMLQTAEAFGCKRMIWHGWPEDKRYSSLDGTKELIGIYNEASRFAKANGLLFGLHNHWWEYRNRVGNRFVYEWLLEGTDKNIFFEIDTYWVKVAGQDPAAIIATFGKRAEMLHMKDGPAIYHDNLAEDNPDPMVALGKGKQNFPAIAKAADDHVKWMVLEMDVVEGDVFKAIKESRSYLLKNGFAVD